MWPSISCSALLDIRANCPRRAKIQPDRLPIVPFMREANRHQAAWEEGGTQEVNTKRNWSGSAKAGTTAGRDSKLGAVHCSPHSKDCHLLRQTHPVACADAPLTLLPVAERPACATVAGLAVIRICRSGAQPCGNGNRSCVPLGGGAA